MHYAYCTSRVLSLLLFSVLRSKLRILLGKLYFYIERGVAVLRTIFTLLFHAYPMGCLIEAILLYRYTVHTCSNIRSGSYTDHSFSPRYTNIYFSAYSLSQSHISRVHSSYLPSFQPSFQAMSWGRVYRISLTCTGQNLPLPFGLPCAVE